MPITRELTPDELQGIALQGLNPDGYKGKQFTLYNDDELAELNKQAPQPTNSTDKVSIPETIGRTLKAHAGGIAGGGLAAIATGLGLGALDVTAPYIGIPLTLAAGFGGGLAGQKIQGKILGEQKQQELEAQQQEAEQQNPKTAIGTDIVASALASGGWPKPSNIPRAIKGLIGREALTSADEAALAQVGREAVSPEGNAIIDETAKNRRALQEVALNAGLNPAINAAIDYARGQKPTIAGLLSQVAGGAVFSGGNPILHGSDRVLPETSDKNWNVNTAKVAEIDEANQTVGINSPFREKDSNGNYQIDDSQVKNAFRTLNPRPNTDGLSDTDRYIAISKWNQLMKQSPENMRTMLHEDYIKKAAANPVDKGIGQTETQTDKVSTKTEEQIEAERIAAQNKTAENMATTGLLQKVAQEQSNKNFLQEQQDKVAQQKLEQQRDQRVEDLSKPENQGDASQWNVQDDINKINKLLAQPSWQEEQERQIHGVPTPSTKINTGKDEVGTIPGSEYKLPQGVEIYPPPQVSLGNTVGETLKLFKPGSKVYDIVKNLNLDEDAKNVKIMVGDNLRTSFYSGADDTIHMKGSHAFDDTTVLHEILHSATAKKIESELKTYFKHGERYTDTLNEYLKTGKNEHLKEIIKAYQETIDHLGMRETMKTLANRPNKLGNSTYSKYYYMGNLHEFISGAMSDRQFSSLLNHLKSSTGESIWTKLITAMKKFLGVDVKAGSILEKVLSPIENLVQQERPNNATTDRNIEGNNRSQHSGTTEERIQSETINRNSNEQSREGLSKEEEAKVGIHEFPGEKLFKASIDKIREIDHPLAGKLADAAYKTLTERQRIVGSQLNPILDKGDKLSGRSDKRLADAARYELENKKDGSWILKTPEERQVFAQEKQSLFANHNYRVATNQPIIQNGVPRSPIRDQWYHPTTPNTKVIEDIKSGEAGRVNKWERPFVDYQVKLGNTPTEAQDNWNAFKDSIQGNIFKASVGGSQQHFGAARRAQGLPLPESMTKPGYMKNLESYFHRMATDNAFYKHIESDPQVMSALGQTKDAWGKPITPSPDGSLAANNSVRSFMKNIQGEMGGAGFHNEKALSSLATIGILGPGTEVHKAIANQVGALDYIDNPYQAAKYLGAVVTNRQQGLEHSIQNGVVRLTAKRLMDTISSDSTFADRIRAIGQGIRKIYTLNDLTDKLGSSMLQAGFEAIIPDKLRMAANGDARNMELFKRLDPDYVRGKTYTPEGVSDLASRLISRIQGTGDARTMPDFMNGDSEISGFFKLSHWSIAQTNRFFQDIITPARNGDYTPLIKAIMGGAIGGYAIKELREKLQGKNGNIPSLKEIASSDRGLSGNAGPLLYNLMAAATYSGFGGMMSMMAKAPLDMIYRNKPSGMVFPLDEFAGDLAGTIKNVTEAIANDPNHNWYDMAVELAKHEIQSNFQLGRVVYNQAINNGIITGDAAEKKQLTDKLNQLRRFNTVEGLPLTEVDQASNPYMNVEQKRFKREQDVPTATKMIPGLINNIIGAYHENPDVMMSKLKALKQNEYSTFPSIEETPLSFMKYLNYLGRTEGPEKAQEALKDFLHHKAVNEAKSSVIP